MSSLSQNFQYRDPLLVIKNLKIYYKLPWQDLTSSDPPKRVTWYFRPPFLAPHTVTFQGKDLNRGAERKLQMEAYKVKIENKNNQPLVKAVDDVSLNVYRNSSVVIIGETGCGKTSLLLSIFKLFRSSVSLCSGEINYHSSRDEYVNLLSLDDYHLNQILGKHMNLILQNPNSALHPLFLVGRQVGEVLEKLSWRQERIRERVIEYLGKVALDQNIGKKHSHQLSGGQAQRVCIASALLADPQILLGDEPLKSLDTVTQGQILQLLAKLKEELNFTYMTVTHNLAVARQLADYIAVMYGGEIIEIQPTEKFFEDPFHPYSKALLQATPGFAKPGLPLAEIKGELPSAANWPSGCKFHPRCPSCKRVCTSKRPPEMQIGESTVKCFFA
ncbi:MAG: ABC transporter ATP-binding protein [Candidatus Hodarchaeota archaeon]